VSSSETLLAGWSIALPAGAAAPVRFAAEVLCGAGAVIDGHHDGTAPLLTLRDPSGRVGGARLGGWNGERTLCDGPAQGSVLTAYAGLRLAGAAAEGARRGLAVELSAGDLRSELRAPVLLRGGTRPRLVRCRDGWVVARWRDPDEADLLAAMVGPLPDRTVADVVVQARLARLLVAPVLPPAQAVPAAWPRVSAPAGPEPSPLRRPQVVDWSVLWAGPWASGQLRRSGAIVHRIEHPRRRDGLLAWGAGRRSWMELNGGKQLSLLDARLPGDHARLADAIRRADILITSMTPRALSRLGFDEEWRQRHAPRLLHLELVAFEPPDEHAAGLGEHAAAQAGLLWRGDRRPAAPAPWPDPLLGASALAFAQFWLGSRSRPGGRLRLSLERAAALALAASDQSGIE